PLQRVVGQVPHHPHDVSGGTFSACSTFMIVNWYCQPFMWPYPLRMTNREGPARVSLGPTNSPVTTTRALRSLSSKRRSSASELGVDVFSRSGDSLTQAARSRPEQDGS